MLIFFWLLLLRLRLLLSGLLWLLLALLFLLALLLVRFNKAAIHNSDILNRLVILHGLHFQLIQELDVLHDLAKDYVLAIKVGRVLERDEELAAVGVWTRIGLYISQKGCQISVFKGLQLPSTAGKTGKRPFLSADKPAPGEAARMKKVKD